LRILCLGNDILADDSFGCRVAESLRGLSLFGVEVVEAVTSGFDLLDYTVGAPALVVVDTLQTGQAAAGTLYELREDDWKLIPGGSPHYIGLFEALAAGRALGLPVPDQVTILAVEAFDCLTVGGPMHPAVEEAVGAAVSRLQELLRQAMGATIPPALVTPGAREDRHWSG
jgi:hydrogenase maturation protease